MFDSRLFFTENRGRRIEAGFISFILPCSQFSTSIEYRCPCCTVGECEYVFVVVIAAGVIHAEDRVNLLSP